MLNRNTKQKSKKAMWLDYLDTHDRRVTLLKRTIHSHENESD